MGNSYWMFRRDRNKFIEEYAPFFFTTWKLTFEERGRCHIEQEDDNMPATLIMMYSPAKFECHVWLTSDHIYMRLTNKRYEWRIDTLDDGHGGMVGQNVELGMEVIFSYKSLEDLEEDFSLKLAWFIEDQEILC